MLPHSFDNNPHAPYTTRPQISSSSNVSTNREQSLLAMSPLHGHRTSSATFSRTAKTDKLVHATMQRANSVDSLHLPYVAKEARFMNNHMTDIVE